MKDFFENIFGLVIVFAVESISFILRLFGVSNDKAEEISGNIIIHIILFSIYLLILTIILYFLLSDYNFGRYLRLLEIIFTLGVFLFIITMFIKSFPSRMRRLHYALTSPILITILLVCTPFFFSNDKAERGISISIAIFIVPAIFAITASRLRDINSNGWFSLLLAIPAINILMIIALMFIPSTEGTNRFGENPKQKGIQKSN